MTARIIVSLFFVLFASPIFAKEVKPPDEMHRAANHKRDTDKAKGLPTPWGSIYKAMAARDNLTNPPEKKS